MCAQAARQVARRLPGVQVHVFSDRDIAVKAEQIKAALDGADVFFGSLLFDFDQVCRHRPDSVIVTGLPHPSLCASHALQNY